ncbi:P-loop NTPase fold protein [Hyunsoonleella sp. 2307UL5-6]|uniref:KAP family P-loop NTPase fold protein n=1 Tax=Hyunsoonleella sp. 2307UL5-6 TaxID=3384768 RepID=UPI0039BC8FB8
MSKLLPNLPIEDLTEENDYLGVIDKGEIIKAFLETNTEEFSQIKMFSLYGEWGSGKSTLMKYLQKELKGDFNTFFFEAWEFESDSNLSLSLLEFLTTESQDSTEEALGEIVEIASKLFKGFSKSMRITFPGLSIDGSKIIETIEEEPEETFLQLKKKFKTEFIRWEDLITKGKNPKYNIVFVDDLDRCEPENVLNLLSALKLFFTYGEKTIFFCGVDKKAVNEAVKTKYGEIVKANEYLEKIFDISFNMPEYDDLLKLVSQYFDNREIEILGDKLNWSISNFFYTIRFTNPRRVKKILNKYQVLRNLKSSKKLDSNHLSLIPDIIDKKNGNFFETIFTLYFLIAYDFRKEIFEDFFNIELKKVIYKDLVNNPQNNGLVFDLDRDFLDAPLDSIVNNLNVRANNLKAKTRLNLIRAFSPMQPKYIGGSNTFFEPYNYIKSFLVDKKDIDYYFSLYLLENMDSLMISKLSDYYFNSYKMMIYKLL